MAKDANELLRNRLDDGIVVSGATANANVTPAVPLSMFARLGLSLQLANLLRKAFAEFLCMTIFIFVGVLVCQQDDLFTIALTHGIMITALVCAFGHISGAHVNPAVTLAVVLSRQMHLVEAGAYVAAQFGGALFGAFLSWAIMKHSIYMAITGGAHAISPQDPSEAQCFLLEVIVTCILVLVILMCAVDQKNCVLAAVGIGFTVAGCIVASGPLSGGSLNPARSLGPLVVYSAAYRGDSYENCVAQVGSDTVSTKFCRSKMPGALWRHSYIHLIAPLLGGALAAGIYHVLFHGINDKHAESRKRIEAVLGEK